MPRGVKRIEAVLAALDTLPVPDPGADYGGRCAEIHRGWRRKPVLWWQVWMDCGGSRGERLWR